MNFLREKYLHRMVLFHLLFSLLFFLVFYLFLKKDLQLDQSLIVTFLHKNMWQLLILFFVFYFGVYYYSKQALKPLQDINKTMDKIVNRGQLPRRLNSKNGDTNNFLTVGAISQLVETIDRQLKIIEETNIVLHGVIENMSNSIILVDHSKRIVLVNQATERILGYQKKELLGKSHIEAARHTEMSGSIEECFKTGRNIIKELTLYYPDKKNVQANFAPMRNEKKQEVIGVVVILVDITEVKTVEKMRRDFVANVSHELKTPITSISGFTETLLDGAYEDKQTLIEFLEIIQSESNRLLRVVNDLLDLTKIEEKNIELKKERFLLKPIIDFIISTLQHKINIKNLNVTNHVADNFWIEADKGKLSQIIINIMDNAIINTPEKGDIIISSALNNNKDFFISIRDSGIGIAKADQKRIFERFYRVDKSRSRENGGTGLGLSIVKHLTEAHQGTIDVVSDLGKGSTFILTIPQNNE